MSTLYKVAETNAEENQIILFLHVRNRGHRAMQQSEYTNALLNFISSSPTAFHAVHNISFLLRKNGFTELLYQDSWNEPTPGSYFVRRNDSSVIAFTLSGENTGETPIRMAGAHTDSPALKIKPNPAQLNHSLLQLGVETYGGALLAPWFDRDLSLAGRVIWRGPDGTVNNSLIDFKRPVAFIPSLAIHLNREADKQKPINRQTDLVPVTMHVAGDETPEFTSILKQQLAAEHDAGTDLLILDHELFLYDHQTPALIGFQDDFISGARLDNLLSCFTLVQGLIDAEDKQDSLIVLNDHEEVGSVSTSGAQGPFLQSVLERLIPDSSARFRTLERSLFISTDNAHGVHPNFSDRHDKEHMPRLNMGPVIKYNAKQRYATTSRTAAFYRELSRMADVPVQEFVMRSDLACGSTIGPITASGTGVQTIDIGAPTLGMHSIRELAGSRDAWYLFNVMKSFFALSHQDTIWQCLA